VFTPVCLECLAGLGVPREPIHLTGPGAGVFGEMLLQSGWFLIPCEALASPLKWWDWRRHMHAWLWLKDREITSAFEIYDTWHVLKFVMQEIDRPPSTPARIRMALWKTYVHHRKHGRLDGIDLHDLSPTSPGVIANTTAIVRDLAEMERVSFDNDLLFGTTPVLVRDRRRIRVRDERLAARTRRHDDDA
jgi:hypothetical protein